MRPTPMTGRGDSRKAAQGRQALVGASATEKRRNRQRFRRQPRRARVSPQGDIEVRPSPNGVTLSASRFPFVPAEGAALTRVGRYPWTLLQSLRVSARHVKK